MLSGAREQGSAATSPAIYAQTCVCVSTFTSVLCMFVLSQFTFVCFQACRW